MEDVSRQDRVGRVGLNLDRRPQRGHGVASPRPQAGEAEVKLNGSALGIELRELLHAIERALADTWPDRVVTMQRNWIGRSEGAHVTFALHTAAGERDIEVYTTRPDTLFGATFMVVAADAALAAEIVHPDRAQALEDYLVEVRKASDIDRLATDRPKTGVDLGITATNPVSGEGIPVWATDYVLADYGTGAIMAVPAHDQRDLDFAKEFGLPVRRVVDTGEDNPEETYVATGGQLYNDLRALLRVYLGWRCTAKLQLSLPLHSLPTPLLGRAQILLGMTGVLGLGSDAWQAGESTTVTINLGRYQGLQDNPREREIKYVAYRF